MPDDLCGCIQRARSDYVTKLGEDLGMFAFEIGRDGIVGDKALDVARGEDEMEDIVTKGRFHRTEVLVERFQFPFHARHLFGCHTLYPLRSFGPGEVLLSGRC